MHIIQTFQDVSYHKRDLQPAFIPWVTKRGGEKLQTLGVDRAAPLEMASFSLKTGTCGDMKVCSEDWLF